MRTNQILCGDSIEITSHFPKECIDLIITDPPYLVNYKDRYGRSLLNDDNPEGVLGIYHQLYRVLKPHSYCITFYGWNAIAQFSKAWHEAGFRSVGHIVWPKRYVSTKGHLEYRHESAYLLVKGYPRKPKNPPADVQTWQYSGNHYHPTQKDVGIISPLIRAYSKPNDIVFDPFLGSGTTAVAAAMNNRSYIGIELDPKYCRIADERISKLKHYSLENNKLCA